MSIREWALLAASAGPLAVGLVATLRRAKSPLALPIALLCFDMFGWNFATFGRLRVTGPLWNALDGCCTALAPPMVLHVVLAFVGKSKAYRWLLTLHYVAFGLLCASSVGYGPRLWDWLWTDSHWAVALFLPAWLPSFVFEVSLLTRHLRRAQEPAEKARARTLLSALVVGGTFASTDLVNDFLAPLPSLGGLGTLFSAAMLATLAIRFELVERQGTLRAIAYLLGMIGSAAVLALIFVRLLGSHLAAIGFCFVLVALFVSVLVRELVGSLTTHREHSRQLLVLGRISSQLAHDLKNPLSALLGAAQVLEGVPAGEVEQQREFRQLIVEQARRIQAIVVRYERLGKLEAQKTTVKVNDLVLRVASPHIRNVDGQVRVELELDEQVPEADLDADLIESAIENLLRNSRQAISGQGVIRIKTRFDAQRRIVQISVADNGIGIDLREAELVFEDFYTTKSTGSGLGLPFVRRVVQAHGGDVVLESATGHGATVTLSLPV